MYYTKTQWK